LSNKENNQTVRILRIPRNKLEFSYITKIAALILFLIVSFSVYVLCVRVLPRVCEMKLNEMKFNY